MIPFTSDYRDAVSIYRPSATNGLLPVTSVRAATSTLNLRGNWFERVYRTFKSACDAQRAMWTADKPKAVLNVIYGFVAALATVSLGSIVWGLATGSDAVLSAVGTVTGAVGAFWDRLALSSGAPEWPRLHRLT
ncbi:hypothetical protein Rhopal_007432-T1 [Rhodotorula paludigena]|uniref:SMODS and SLOG-associating 2TM effector domain-containing protein n=1 Tax=Rhodotorula paludigena TaxID=86838 RepID=A0AAV5H0U7_9BASI|nr:hypothetical protein Rhopal_007432-T1 [Rhodotorula paludigena]